MIWHVVIWWTHLQQRGCDPSAYSPSKAEQSNWKYFWCSRRARWVFLGHLFSWISSGIGHVFKTKNVPDIIYCIVTSKGYNKDGQRARVAYSLLARFTWPGHSDLFRWRSQTYINETSHIKCESPLLD